MDNIFKFIFEHSAYSYSSICLIIILSSIGVPFPEELSLVIAGFLVHMGAARGVPMLALCSLAIFLGDMIAYLLGHFYGWHIKDHKLAGQIFSFRRIRRVERLSQIFGSWVIVFGRFATGIRPLVFLFAGITRINMAKVFVVDLVGSFVSAGIWIPVGWFLSRHIELLLVYFFRLKNFVIYSIIFFAVIYLLDKYLVSRKVVRVFPDSKLRKFILSMMIAVAVILLGVAWQTMAYRLYLIRHVPGLRLTVLYTSDELTEILRRSVTDENDAAEKLRPNIVFTGRMHDIEAFTRKCGWEKVAFFSPEKKDAERFEFDSGHPQFMFKSGRFPGVYLYLWRTAYYWESQRIWLGMLNNPDALQGIDDCFDDEVRQPVETLTLKKHFQVQLYHIPLDVGIEFKARYLEKISELHNSTASACGR